MVRKITIILLSLILTAIASVAVVILVNNKGDSSGKELGAASGSGSDQSGNIGSNGSQGGSGGTSSGGGTSSDDSSTSGDVTEKNEVVETHVCKFIFTSEESAGCLTQGYKLYSCDCGKTEKRDFVPHLGHDFAWTETKKATCTEDGEKTGNCTRCTATDSASIQKLNHDYGAYENNNDADCTHDGTETAECSRCGNKVNRTIPNSMLAHNYGEYKSNNDSTCTAYGTKTARCNDCGKVNTIRDDNAAPYHRYGSWYTTVDATCKREGQRSRKCSVCGDVNTISTGYGNHEISGTSCTLCGEAIQNKKGNFYLNPKTNDGEGNFGTVYLEFEVISVSNYVMTYEMYIVQSYTENGQNKQTRDKIVIANPDNKNCGSYEITLWSINDNRSVKFYGWIDYDTHEAERWVTPIVGISGGSYSCTERFYLTY